MTEKATDVPEFETWENVTQGRVVVKKFSAKGDLIDEMIGGNKKFHLSTQERHINEERAANDELDPFSNGTLSPVRLLDSTEDAAEIAANPNLMSETEMKSLLKLKAETITERVVEVRNPALIQRLLELASEVDCPISKVNAIKERLAELSPSLYNEVVYAGSTETPAPDPSDGPRAAAKQRR